IGALGVGFTHPSDFDADARAFAAQLGREFANALERARLFDAERRARVEAETASAVKDDFIRTLSFELRAPLTVIGTWVQLLKRSGPGDKRRCARALDVTHRAVQ